MRHGMRKTRIYRRWASLKTRCLNSNDPSFRYYGGRGVSLCDSWRSFENFYRDMGDCPDGMQLDRIDNEKGYSKENCRWVSRAVNANNKRNNRPLTLNGETKNIGQWAKGLGVTHGAVFLRLKKRDLKTALTAKTVTWEQPTHWRFISAFGKTLPLKQWCALTGLKRTTITERIRKGMAPELALSKNSSNIGGLS